MRNSRVVLTDEEVSAKLEKSGVKKPQIDREIMERQTAQKWAQDAYDAPRTHGLAPDVTVSTRRIRDA